jgi:hypothetical protein
MSQGYVECPLATGEDGAALSNTTTPTSILPAARKITLPPYFFDRVGKMVRVFASGRISTLTAAPGTLTLDLRFGSIIVFTGGAMNLNVTAQTNATWRFNAEMTCRTIGSGTSANLLSTAEWKSRAIIGSVTVATGGDNVDVIPDTAPAVGTGFDSTALQQVDFFATWSVANSANSILCHQFALELLN